MAFKSQMLRNCVALLKHSHRNPMVARFPQFASRAISTNFLLPVHRRHSSPAPPAIRPQSLNMCSQTSPDPPPSDSPVPTKTVKVVATGRVHGVNYRSWTVENATALGLKGYVRSRGDGSIEALFSGDADKVDEMQERCRTGPPLCVVTKFVVSDSTEDPGTGFERRPHYRISTKSNIL